MSNLIQQTLSNIRNKANELLNDNQGFFQQGKFTLQPVTSFVQKQQEQAKAAPLNTIGPFVVPNWQNPQGQDVYKSFGSGLVNSATFGLVNPNYQPQSGYGKYANVLGNVTGMIVPGSPAMKGMGLVDKLAGQGISKIAPKLTTTLAGKIATGIGKEAAQTLAYAGASKLTSDLGLNQQKDQFSPQNLATNLALGSAFRGVLSPQGTGLISKGIKNLINPDAFVSDIKFVNEARQRLATTSGIQNFNNDEFKLLADEANNYNKKLNLMPQKEFKSLNIGQQYDLIHEKLQEMVGSGKPPLMGLVDNKPKGVIPEVGGKAEVKISSQGNMYIKKGANDIVQIPNTIKEDIYKASQGQIPTPERRLKANTILNRSGLEMDVDGKIVSQSPSIPEVKTKIETPVPPVSQPQIETPIRPSNLEVAPGNQSALTGNIPQKPSVDNLLPLQPKVEVPETKIKFKTGLEKTGKQKAFLENVAGSEKSTEPLVQQTKTLEQTYETLTNKQSVSQATKLIKQSADEAKNFVYSDAPLDSVKTATGIELAKQYEKQGNIDEAVAMINELDQQLRQAGRGIQAASLWNKMSPETLVRTANRIAEKNKQVLSKEVQGNILTRMRKVSKMVDGVDKDNATLDVLNYIADNVKPTPGEVFDAYRYTNMLSNPRSHERNIYGNLFNTLVTRPLDIGINATYDLIKNPVNPMARDVHFSDVPTYYKNVFNSIGTAFDAAKEGLKSNNMKVDAVGAENAIDALRRERVPGVFKVIPKFMEAQDQFFSTLIASGEKARLMKNGMSDVIASEKAGKLAEKYLLREKLGKAESGYIVKALDSLGNLAMSGRKLPVIGKAWSWFVPFVKTPINFAKMSVEHSILGLPGAKMTTENLAKATAGSLFMAYAGKLAMEDRTTLNAPTDPKQKELFYAAGKKPFSVKIGDTWVPMTYLGPFGLSLMIPAAMKQRFQDDPGSYTDDVALKSTRVVSDVSKYLASQTPLKGIGDFVSLLDGDSEFTLQSILGGMASQAIPLAGMNRWVNTVIDDVYRKGSDMKSQVMKSIPGGTFNLEPYTEPTGELSKRLPQNQFLPYDIGKQNTMYAGLEQQRLQKLQANKEENLLKKQLEQGKTASGISGDKIAYINEGGTPSILDLTKYEKIASLPATNKYQQAIKESKQYSEAAKIMDNTALSTEQQQTALKRLGVDPDKADYYRIANDNTNLKTMFVLDAINKVKTQGGGFADIVQLLSNQRTEVNGQMIASNAVLDNLVSEGILNKSQATQLKKYKMEGGKLTPSKKSSGGGKKIKISTPKKVTPVKVKSMKAYKPKKLKLSFKKSKPIKLKMPRLKFSNSA